MTRTKGPKQFALCTDNSAFPASLERWKIYRVLPDSRAAADHLLRVLDESGEDYLFPAACFTAIALSPALVRLYGRGGRRPTGRAAIRTA